MINVKVKCRESALPDIGTLYPNVVTRFLTVDVDSSSKEEVYNFVIWYNNRKSLLVDVHVKRREEDGFLDCTTKYLDKNQQEFKHPWQGIGHKNDGDSAHPQTYQPQLHN